MARHIALIVLATAVLAGCSPALDDLPKIFRVELSKPSSGADPDITRTSLRPDAEYRLPKLPRPAKRTDLSLRLRNSYGRLQLQAPMLPRRLPVQLSAIARSYWEPDNMGEPRGKFLLRLHIPLSSVVSSESLRDIRQEKAVYDREDVRSVALSDWPEFKTEETEASLNEDWILGLTFPAVRAADRK